MRYASLVQRLDGAGAAAWDIHYAALAAHRRGEDVIFASIGDPDVETPEPITARAVEALVAGDSHYTDIPGRLPLRQAVAERMARSGMTCGAENVVIVAGAQNGLFAAALCLFETGDEVILLEPAYVTYEATFGLTGAKLVRVGMSVDRGFRLDADALRAAVTPRTRGIVFSNPNNPTGVVMSVDDLAAIAAIATAHDLWIVADEVYASLVFERPHHSIAALPGMDARTVTIGSLSKSHAMTGWRIGWVAGPADLVRHINRLAMNMLYGLPGFVQEAALVAMQIYDAVATETMIRYRTRRDIVVERLRTTPHIDVLVPEAGMFVLIDTRSSGRPPLELAWALFRETGVSTLDATAFGHVSRGFLRMTFALADAELVEACRRIDGFFRRLVVAP